MAKTVLVTGADGFIGSHLTEMLLEKGYDVKAFTFYNSFNNWGWLDTLPEGKLSEINIFSGDIRDPNGVREAMRGVDMVFHLAALIAIRSVITLRTLMLIPILRVRSIYYRRPESWRQKR